MHALGWLASGITGTATLGLEFGLGSALGPAAVAKLMTKPAFVKWLAEGTQKAATDPNSIAQHIRRLVQIQAVNPEIRDEIRALLQGLQGETAEP